MVVTARKTTLPFLRDWRQTAEHPQALVTRHSRATSSSEPMQAHHPRKSLPTGTILTDSPPPPTCFSVLSPLHTCKGPWPPIGLQALPQHRLWVDLCLPLHPSSLPRPPSSSIQQTPIHPSNSRCHLLYSVISVSCLY